MKSHFPGLNYDPNTLPRELTRHYISATEKDISDMLNTVGATCLEDLYAHVPSEIRMAQDPAIPEELGYAELLKHLDELSRKNHVRLSFLGDGLPHYKVPEVVPHILSIRNLTTAYTPYQPERSQGTLTSIWIYQCAISALTGYEAVNASFYERSTGLFEAIKCAQRLRPGSDTAVIAKTLYPGDVEVLRTMAADTDLKLVFVDADEKTGRVSPAALEEAGKKAGEKLAALVFPQLNFLGLLEDVDGFTNLAADLGTRSIAVIDPMTIAANALKPPSAFGREGASMFVAEAQHLSIAPNFSGPGLGLFGIRYNANNKNDIRATAGRFIGKGKDLEGRDCFAIVLSTREQHIRRDKATSNICSNQSYLATLTGAALLERGDEGLEATAKLARENAVHAVEKLTSHVGVDLAYPEAPFWNEICLKVSKPVPELIERARHEGLHLGVDVSSRVPGKGNLILVSLTDRHARMDIEKLGAFFAKEFPHHKENGHRAAAIPANQIRQGRVEIPRIAVDKIKAYYDKLGDQNVSPDDNIYALGSCTMKYNPYVNDWAAALPGFAELHPQAPAADAQGSFEILYRTQEYFKAITGLPAVTTQPMAGAQGELVGIKMFQAYHRDAKQNRDIVLIPRSAHGTNPATATMAGYAAANLKLVEADTSGQINMEQLKSLVAEFGPRISCIMITNPNTSGILESNFKEVADLVHAAGGLVYMDGANMNAIAGWVDLGKMGVDAVHNNTHKTWSIPHGGGGPGDAFVAVSDKLIDYLPGIQAHVNEKGVYRVEKPARSIGSVQRHFGNFGHKVRCYTYLRALGKEGVPRMSAVAVLSARYLFHTLKKHFPTLPAGAENTPRMHEFILTLSKEMFSRVEQAGVQKSLAIPRIGKLFLDFGLHAPTVAFPEVLGLMIEPTESYAKHELDDFLRTVETICQIVQETPEVLQTVPHFTPIDRVDEVLANKNLTLSEKLTWNLLPILPNRAEAKELTKMGKGDVWKKIVDAHQIALAHDVNHG
ncbi:MAG: aminotransferase class V-fold PLP-dependent enzyme [Proteobacteria bacterium]|nr:MAG: aminotransferase class V-fold PLP-dependent enzyme [Pseudomonadota bacterium]